MSPLVLQLWVERLALDPAAWTAAHALQLLLGATDAPVRVGRADLWELEALDAPDGAEARAALAARFDAWMRTSNLFMNPGRDRALVLDGAPGDGGTASAHVVCVDRGLAESRAHGITVGHALGGRWRVRRGNVWTLEWPPERAEDVPGLVEQAAWAKRRHGGLLVNAESQDARLYVAAWDCPALPPAEEAGAKAGRAGGSDGGVA
jgi:hypothetical protein